MGGVSIKRGMNHRRQQPRTRINDMIRDPEIRVIADDGEQLSVTCQLKIKDARFSYQHDSWQGGRGPVPNLDVTLVFDKNVEVAPNGKPPVCRIMDYGKYLYMEQKRAQQAKKKQKRIQIKEMKFRPKIDEHDYAFKKKHVIRFLEAGDRVKITIRFRGRELAHKDKGREILARLKEELAEYGAPEREPTQEGIHMVQIFVPKSSGTK